MNLMIRVALFSMYFALPSLAFTPAETNRVTRRILYRMVAAGSHDDWSSRGLEEWIPEVFADLDHFLVGIDCPGWTLDEKRHVFDLYLANLSTCDVRNMSNDDKLYASAALAHCYDLSYTNAAPYYRQLALNPLGYSRRDAMRLYLRSVGVGPDATSFTEAIITNAQGNVSYERFQAVRLYSEMLTKRLGSGVAVSDGVAMFYRNRNRNVTGSITIDKLLVASLHGYGYSSNRLETCCFVIDSTNATERMTSYFISITNQLLSSSQPLRRINVGGTNP